MPQSPSPLGGAEAPSSVTSYGQVIEYLEDRVYLASYTYPPDDKTPFPYPPKAQRSPTKRSSRAQPTPQAVQSTEPAPRPVYFSIDKSLLYNAFHADFGPLHIGHLYRFAVQLHAILSHPETENRPVVFWSNADPRSRANAACLLACYMVIIQAWPPHLALAPISQMDPPCMPFRDAGYSQADYALTVQDVVYGVWKAKEEGLVGFKDFDLEEYERHERVDMGDFNWVTPSFVAFASPQHKPTHVIQSNDPLYAQLPRSLSALYRSKTIPTTFKIVLSHFVERNVGLVVRLNSELYSSSYFTALGVKHLDMIFDDGTCPDLDIVRKFINVAHRTIAKGKGIAVHCKAGLGRTGSLIGAYLIYRHGFTANEVIAYMRFMRPGMVVGPQQHWLHLNQGTFREWWYEDTMKEKILASLQAQPMTPTRLQSKRPVTNGQTYTPPNVDRQSGVTPRRAALGEITNNEQVQISPAYRVPSDTLKSGSGVADENLPAPTPGQPRKTNKIYGSRRVMGENQPFGIKPDSEIVSMQRSTISVPEEEINEAYGLNSLSRKASQSPVNRSGKRRAISCTTTTTTTTKWDGLTSAENSDSENHQVDVPGELDSLLPDHSVSPSGPKTPYTKSGSGIGSLSVGKRSSPIRRSTEGRTSVRKTSGRVGSIGSQPMRAHKAC